ncbi:DUF2306 domain-containing protein [Lysobacter tyrosinilyticus]
MKLVHIAAGLLALISGFIALFAAKGSPLHRKAGTVFVGAMLVMASTGALMAVFIKPNPVNVMAGSMTCYLVGTAMLAVKRTVAQMRGVTIALMLAALSLSAWAFSLAFMALASPTGTIGHVPPQPLFMFAIAGLAGGLLDARMLWAGHIEGAHRIARHLWRMGFAMWIATTSFFIGQATVFPDYLRQHIGLRAIPVLVVTLVVLYWLARTLISRRPHAIAHQNAMENP